jgi:hypothetical protein
MTASVTGFAVRFETDVPGGVTRRAAGLWILPLSASLSVRMRGPGATPNPGERVKCASSRPAQRTVRRSRGTSHPRLLVVSDVISQLLRPRVFAPATPTVPLQCYDLEHAREHAYCYS